MGVINIEVAAKILPQRAQKGGSSMGNRQETIRGADAVCMRQVASELGIGEDSDEIHEDDDRPEGIRLNPFADEGGGVSGQSHIKVDLFGAEGGEA